MKTRLRAIGISFVVLFSLGLIAEPSSAFNSGSTGVDGAFNPLSDIEVQLPPSGIFNFTSVNIPSGVTVTFKKNATNTPVVILVSGDFTLAGIIDISGAASSPKPLSPGGSGGIFFSSGGKPGAGGPGGYDGGRGATLGGGDGGNGLGPGGGVGGRFLQGAQSLGGGGGYATNGFNAATNSPSRGGIGGQSYGSNFLLPLIGGSGGGGSTGRLGTSFVEFGVGGGGGGGAVLIAASGTVFLNQGSRILAGGGEPFVSSNQIYCGAGGSGGAIRIVATVVNSRGRMDAVGGTEPFNCNNFNGAGRGSEGRIRIESEQLIYVNDVTAAPSVPVPSFDIPGAVVLTGPPALTITSVAGVAAPAAPTGNTDITLPAATTNPVSVGFATTAVPPGATINLTVTPSYGEAVTATSSPLVGTTASATATASVNLPTGHSVFVATVSYTVVASLGDAMSRFANNERVERIVLTATFGGPTKAKLVTVSGREYEAPAEALRIAANGARR